MSIKDIWLRDFHRYYWFLLGLTIFFFYIGAMFERNYPPETDVVEAQRPAPYWTGSERSFELKGHEVVLEILVDPYSSGRVFACGEVIYSPSAATDFESGDYKEPIYPSSLVDRRNAEIARAIR